MTGSPLGATGQFNHRVLDRPLTNFLHVVVASCVSGSDMLGSKHVWFFAPGKVYFSYE